MNNNIHKYASKIRNKYGNHAVSYVKDFVNFGFNYFITSVIGFVVVYFVNNNLEPEQMGIYSYNKSIFTLLSSILTLRIFSAYFRFNTKGVSRKLYGIARLILIISVGLLGLIGFFLTNSIIASLFAFIIVFNERTDFFRSIMKVNMVNAVRFVSIFATLILVVGICYSDYELTSNLVLFSYGVGYFICIFFRNKNEYVEDKDTLPAKNIFKYCLPGFCLVAVDWLITFSGQLFLKEVYNFTAVAYFAIAQRSLLVVQLFSGLLLTFWPMLYYREMEAENYDLIKVIRICMIAIMVTVGVLAVLYKDLIYSVLGASEYVQYSNLFVILVISHVINTIATFYAAYLGFILKTYWSLIISTVGSIVNLAILTLCINDYGIEVVPIAILISNIIMFLGYYFISFTPEKKYIQKQKNS